MNEHAILGYAGGLEFFAAVFDGYFKQVTISPADSFPGKVN
jgi:hypothetical protein